MAKQNWAASLRETGFLGREYGSPNKFTDMPSLDTFKARSIVPQMKKLDVHHDGKLVYGLEVHYDGAVSHLHMG